MKRFGFIFIAIVFSLLLSGCETNYDINISEDLSVTEDLSFAYDLGSNEYDGYNSERDIFESMYEGILEEATDSNYEITNRTTDSKVDLTFKRKSSFERFNSPILSEIYSYFDASCNEDKCSVISVANKTDIEGDGTYMNYKVRITVPYKVLKQNADEIDLKNNTYIWYYIVGGKQSDIELTFEKTGKNIIESNKRNSFIVTIIITVIGLVVLGFIFSVVYRIIKNNRPSL